MFEAFVCVCVYRQAGSGTNAFELSKSKQIGTRELGFSEFPKHTGPRLKSKRSAESKSVKMINLRVAATRKNDRKQKE